MESQSLVATFNGQGDLFGNLFEVSNQCENSKQCLHCKKILAIDFFIKKETTNTGYTRRGSICKQCDNKQMRILRRLKKRHLRPPSGTLCAVPNCQNEAQCLDHDHSTGKARAYICSKHNSAFGFCGDSVTGVMDLLEYAKRWEP